MATESPTHKYYESLRRKPTKMLNYTGNSECLCVINNNMPNISIKKQVETFAKWFKNLIDNDRNNIGLYVAEDATLQWFGRTVKLKKNISGFLKYDMHCTSHNFISVKPCGPFTMRGEKNEDVRKSGKNLESTDELAIPISGITPYSILKSLTQVPSKNSSTKRTRSVPSSPETAITKKIKTLTKKHSTDILLNKCNSEENLSDVFTPVNTRAKYELRSLYKRKNVCLKIDAQTNINQMHTKQIETTGEKIIQNFSKTTSDLTYLPRSFMEVKCVLQFSKNKSRRTSDLYKWERHCTLQVAFSENPVCKGEYIIWAILYSDNSKCRRNLLADFDAVSKESEK